MRQQDLGSVLRPWPIDVVAGNRAAGAGHADDDRPASSADRTSLTVTASGGETSPSTVATNPGVNCITRRARALFLPQVWQSLADPRAFLSQLKLKAGLAADYWGPDVEAWRFTTDSISSTHIANPLALWSTG